MRRHETAVTMQAHITNFRITLLRHLHYRHSLKRKMHPRCSPIQMSIAKTITMRIRRNTFLLPTSKQYTPPQKHSRTVFWGSGGAKRLKRVLMLLLMLFPFSSDRLYSFPAKCYKRFYETRNPSFRLLCHSISLGPATSHNKVHD